MECYFEHAKQLKQRSPVACMQKRTTHTTCLLIINCSKLYPASNKHQKRINPCKNKRTHVFGDRLLGISTGQFALQYNMVIIVSYMQG